MLLFAAARLNSLAERSRAANSSPTAPQDFCSAFTALQAACLRIAAPPAATAATTATATVRWLLPHLLPPLPPPNGYECIGGFSYGCYSSRLCTVAAFAAVSSYYYRLQNCCYNDNDDHCSCYYCGHCHGWHRCYKH